MNETKYPKIQAALEALYDAVAQEAPSDPKLVNDGLVVMFGEGHGAAIVQGLKGLPPHLCPVAEAPVTYFAAGSWADPANAKILAIGHRRPYITEVRRGQNAGVTS
jgi:hypothetical protein